VRLTDKRVMSCCGLDSEFYTMATLSPNIPFAIAPLARTSRRSPESISLAVAIAMPCHDDMEYEDRDDEFTVMLISLGLGECGAHGAHDTVHNQLEPSHTGRRSKQVVTTFDIDYLAPWPTVVPTYLLILPMTGTSWLSRTSS